MSLVLPILFFSINGLFVQADVGHTPFENTIKCHEVVDRLVAEVNADPKKPEGLMISGGCLTAPPSITGVAPTSKKDKSKDTTI